MKAFKLKMVTVPADPEVGQQEQTINYRMQLLVTLRTPANPQGADFAEMAKVLPIMDKLNAAEDGDSLLLETAEHEYLCERVKTARWGMNHPAIYQLVTDVLEAPDQKVEAVKDANAH